MSEANLFKFPVILLYEYSPQHIWRAVELTDLVAIKKIWLYFGGGGRAESLITSYCEIFYIQ